MIELENMFYRLGQRQKIALYFLALLGLFICGYIGSWYLHQPAPIKFEQKKLIRQSPTQNTNSKKIQIHVLGAVQTPGIYQLDEEQRIHDAIEKAGGALPDANLEKINLASKVKDGAQVFIPSEEQETKPEVDLTKNLNEHQDTALTLAGKNVEPQQLNLNEATEAELQTIPGIGPSTAAMIIEYRDSHQGFHSADELRAVKGIGEKKMEKIRPYIRVEK